jgi:uncharacterized membrane protein
MHIPHHPVQKSKNFLKLVEHTPEGRVFIAFLITASVTIILNLIVLIINQDAGKTMLKVLVVNSMGGRGPAVGLGLMGGLSPLATFAYNMLLELLNLFFAYSLFALSINHYLEFSWLIKIRTKIEQSAHKYEHIISKYGALGVFLFVSLPLPMTGPVMGSVIAHFLRFSTKKIMLIVIPGCIVALASWVAFLTYLSSHKQAFRIFLVIFLIITIVGVLRILPVLIKKSIAIPEKK